MSLAALLREIVHEYLAKLPRPTARRVSKRLYMSVVGLGSSGAHDVSERHDEYVGRAVYEHYQRHSLTAYCSLLTER
jgi:hypothetical protein